MGHSRVYSFGFSTILYLDLATIKYTCTPNGIPYYIIWITNPKIWQFRSLPNTAIFDGKVIGLHRPRSLKNTCELIDYFEIFELLGLLCSVCDQDLNMSYMISIHQYQYIVSYEKNNEYILKKI